MRLMQIYIITEDEFWQKSIKLNLNTQATIHQFLLAVQSIESALDLLNNKNFLNKLDKNTFFIAQGIACQALMRFLGNNFKKIKEKRLGGLIFLDAWLTIKTDDAILQEWNKTPMDYQTIFKIIPYKKFSVFLDTPENKDSIKDIWEQRLEAEVNFINKSENISKLMVEKLSEWT